MKNLPTIQQKLIDLLKSYQPILKVTVDTDEKFEVTGTVKAMQGKKEVDGIYFASVVPKPKDIRLYFFPIYTHKDEMGELSEKLKKALKGKSCFHIKAMDEVMEKELQDMIGKGVEVYRGDGLL